MRQISVLSIGPGLAALLLAVGCQSYAPRPVDLASHHEVWASRTAGNAEVAALASAIRDVEDDASQPGELTLSRAEAVALLFNADLRLARSRAGVTAATFEHAGLWDDPVLSIMPERMLSSGPHPWNIAASIGFTLPVSGRLEVEKRRAGAAHHAALHAVAEQEWQIRMDLRRAWIEWSAASLQREVTEDFLGRLDAIVNIIDRMQEIGELAPIQARVFQIEQLERRNQARALDGTLRERGIALRRLMGLPPDAPLDASPQVALEDRPAMDGDIAAAIRTHHPRIRTLLAEYETAERALELAVRGQYPDIEFGPGFGRDEGANMLLLGISLPIPIFNQNRQAIAEARSERDHARAVVETAYEAILSELASAEAQHEAAAAQSDRMLREIVPLVDQQYADARHIAELGEVDTLLLIDTLRRQYEAKLQVIELEARRSLAAVRIMELLGPADGADQVVDERLLQRTEPNP